MKTVKTFLPVFNGYYSTLLGDKLEVDNELDYLNEKNTGEEITHDDLEIDYKTAFNDLSKKVCINVSEELIRIGLIESYIYEGLYSPREYDFTNDSINVEFAFSDSNIEAIKKYLIAYSGLWSDYLKEKFTSCSGFHSFYSNNPEHSDWSNIEEALNHKTKCGSILDFILLNEGYDTEKLYYDIEFYMSEYITVKNKTKKRTG